MSSKKKKRTIGDFIEPLEMNGLQGRMLRLPAPPRKKREILIIYGHHASIERMFGMAEFLNRYGSVTLPDMPGFGGMESFYKIGQKPTLDNLADYFAAFMKLRYKRRRVTIVATSFGFVVITRMLQRYPELAKKVDLLISFVGFVHKDDFKLKRSEYLTLRYLCSFGSNRLPAWVLQHLIFRPAAIRLMYTALAPKHAKLKDADKAEQQARIEFETYLWQCNDVRTKGDTGVTFLTLDLCDKQVDLPVYHVAVDNDHYFDNAMVEQHLNVVYKKVHVMEVSMPAHAPTVIADAGSVAPFVPTKLRRILARNP
jgi:pimeloyl-ACP methyl ester carboxylesterase